MMKDMEAKQAMCLPRTTFVPSDPDMACLPSSSKKYSAAIPSTTLSTEPL